MSKKKIVISILAIGVILLGGLAFLYLERENIKIYGKRFVYPTEQYLAVDKNDDIWLSLIFVDGKKKTEEMEASLETIVFIDKNGKQYKSKKQSMEVFENNKAYALYQIDLQLENMETGEYVFNHLLCNGNEYEIGSVVLDVINEMEEYEFEVGMSPKVYGGTYGFSIKNTKKDTIRVLNLYYDFKGNGQKNCIEINEDVPKGKEKEFTVDIKELYGKNTVLSAYIEIAINGEKNNIILSVPTTSFEGLSKQDILNYTEQELE